MTAAWKSVMQGQHFVVIAAALVASSWVSDVFAQVNAPSELQVVPRYDVSSISLTLSWTDNAHGANNEQGFEIQAREVGGTFTTIANVAANVTDYEDTAATANKWWEYRVRATHAVLGNSAWTGVSDQNSPRQTWPIHTGTHNVLYTHAQPITAGGSDYFHGGTDISGAGDQVDVARGGIVTRIDNSVGGTLHLNVDYGADGMYEDWYLHTVIDPVLAVDDNLVVGTKVGNISTTYFGHADKHHLHWGMRFHNLAKFTNIANLDPNNQAPVVADTNGDGDDFIVVDAATNDHTMPRDPAWGEVDFLVDAYDDMTPGNNNRAAPLVTGYWIESHAPGGENVRSAAQHYRLLNFDMTRTSYSGATGVENDVFYNALPADLLGANIWGVYLTWIPTNAKGTDGALANVDGAQHWKTDARKGSGTRPNGSDASKARENQEARFPDGAYSVHIVLEDFVHTSDTVRPVVVDNSRPYVKRVTVRSGPYVVYDARWKWHRGAARLSIQPSTFEEAAFTALRTLDINIEVEFSEPMQSTSITTITPSGGAAALGVVPTLSSTQPLSARTIWRGRISKSDISNDGAHDGRHMLTIAGIDLAGNSLLAIGTRADMGANHHNRNAAGTLRGTPGTDTIHGFKIGPPKSSYAVKVVCGIQKNPDDLRLARGIYATAVNIYNPNAVSVKFYKELALTYPPEKQRPGKVHPITIDKLGANQALEVDCNDLRHRLFKNGFPESYIKGFLVLRSEESLDVVAVYTTAALDKEGHKLGQHTSIDVETIPERVHAVEREVDLRIRKDVKVLRTVSLGAAKLKTIQYEIQVTNQGPSGATNVVVDDALQLIESTLAEVTESSFESSHGGSWSVQSTGPSTATLRVEVPSVPAAETVTLKFVVTVAIDFSQGEPRARLRNTASVRSDTPDTNAGDNSVTVTTPLS